MEQKTLIDHLDRTVEYSYPPKKIVSIAPGLTDTLYALNLDNEIVGRTRYCIYPKNKVEQAKTVGGTKKINLETIKALNPDIIFAEKEENTKEIVELLEKHFPTYVCEVKSIDDAHKMIKDLGIATNRTSEAEALSDFIREKFTTLPQAKNKRVAYVIWKNPYMVVGNDTYIQSLLEEMGFENAFKSFEGRYPVVTEEDLQHVKLDYLLLASEPFPFTEEHKQEFSFLPDVKKVIIDGEMFWYGPRMIEAVDYLKSWFKNLSDH